MESTINERIETAVLPNGLRVVVEHTDGPVVNCGIVVSAGTRHEDGPDSGMAHFLEHMSFKGTAHRRSCHIARFLESVGGDLNAFTTKQETVYCATVMHEDFRRAADVLCDIVFRSIYPQAEIDKEVEVIADEIDSYRDAPAELIFDEFESLLFGNADGLGRDILGDADRLRQYTTADARRFADRYYRPENCTFYLVGSVSLKTVCHALQHYTQ